MISRELFCRFTLVFLILYLNVTANTPKPFSVEPSLQDDSARVHESMFKEHGGRVLIYSLGLA